MLRTVLVFTLLLTALPAGAQERADASSELRRITQALLDAVAPGKTEVWDTYLHERLVHVDENGVVRTKRELLKELTPLPPGLVGRIEIDMFKVELQGDLAIVANEAQEHLDYHGQILRSRFRSLDTWLKTPAGWRLIGQHTAAVLKVPPAVKLTQAQLCAYNGTYSLTPAISATVKCTVDGLIVERSDRPATTYVAELADIFFVPGQPRSRRIFLRDENGKIVAFVDRREGEDVRWNKRA